VESTRVQEVPLHALPYPENVKPEPAVAVSVTLVPDANEAEQVVGQLMPAGLLVTVPVPVTETVNCAFGGGEIWLEAPQAEKNSTQERETMRAKMRELKRGLPPSSCSLGA
jgi:type VI protein secretion system component VasA